MVNRAPAHRTAAALLTLLALTAWKANARRVSYSTKTLIAVELMYYDCLATTVERHGGKCVLQVESENRSHALLAAPEVAAPYSNFYGPLEAHPLRRLVMLVSLLPHVSSFEGEVLEIRDDQGRTISRKIDYGR